MSGIFDDDEKLPMSGLEPLAMAMRLKFIVQKKLNHLAPIRAALWSEELRRLVRDTNNDAPRVERVLNWYDGYCSRHDSIKCYSAASFRRMFYALEDRCNKEAKFSVDLCPISMEIAAKLRESARWHGGSDAKLDSAVKRSLDAYSAYRRKLLQSPPDEEMDRFIQWSGPELIRDPVDFVYAWFMMGHRRVRTWKEWNGNLEPFVFAEDCDGLAKWGSDLAAAYGDRRLWNRLVDSIKGVPA